MSEHKHPSPLPPQQERWTPGSLRDTYFARKPTVEQECDTLERVRSQLMQETQDAPPASSWQTLRRSWRWSIASTALAGACGVLWLLWPGSVVLPDLQLQGTAPLAQRGQQAVRYQLTPQQTARVQAPKRWDLRIKGGTRLALSRTSVRQTRIRLQRGRIDVHVTPGRDADFQVVGPRWKVQVKGTRFRVEHAPGWVRVEVLRGQVGFQLPKQQILLNRGQGARLTLKSLQLQRYALPPTAQRAPMERIKWLRQKDSSAMVSFALDFSTRPDISREKRLALLKYTVESMISSQRFSQITALLQRIRALENDLMRQQNTFYQWTERCYRQARKETACLPLSRWYLETFSKNNQGLRLYLERIHYHHALTLANQKAPQQGLKMLMQNRVRFPKSLQRRKVCRRIQLALRNQSLNMKRIKQALKLTPSWFQTHCKF